MKNKLSVVIAAYNEETRIAKVLEVVEHHPLIDEVIVVNDGSADKTSDVVRKFDVKLIENDQNMGKTLSVKRGIEASKNDIIMLLDADLKGLTADAIDKLARPVLDGNVDWTLSIRKNSAGFMRLFKMDWISGERVAPKKMLLDPLIWSRPDIGYGLETLMNKSFLENGASFQSVYLPSVYITRKSEKIGFWQGIRDDVKMIKSICKVIPFRQMVAQFITMARLNGKRKVN